MFKWRWAALGYVGFASAYWFLGHSTVRPLTLLSPNILDVQIPFWPSTVWIYLSQFALVASAVALCRDNSRLIQAAKAALIVSVLAFLVFSIWPTAMVRPPLHSTALTSLAFSLLYAIDPPTNCLPSLHAALATLAAWTLARTRWHIAIFLWAFLVIISTLTTKQHYFFDVLAGELLAVLGLVAARQWSPLTNERSARRIDKPKIEAADLSEI